MKQFSFFIFFLVIPPLFSLPLYYNGTYHSDFTWEEESKISLSRCLPFVDELYSFEISSSTSSAIVTLKNPEELGDFNLSRNDDYTNFYSPGISIENIKKININAGPLIDEIIIWIPFESSFFKNRIEAVSHHFGIKSIIEIVPDPAATLYQKKINREKEPDIIIFPVIASQQALWEFSQKIFLFSATRYTVSEKSENEIPVFPVEDLILTEKILQYASLYTNDPMKLYISHLDKLLDRKIIKFDKNISNIKLQYKWIDKISTIPLDETIPEFPELILEFAYKNNLGKLSSDIFLSELISEPMQNNIPVSSGFFKPSRKTINTDLLNQQINSIPRILFDPAYTSLLELYLNEIISEEEFFDRLQ